MNLGVIGEPCIDYIHREGMEPRKHLGGILYSVISLAVIARNSDNIYPIMNLGEDEFGYVIANLEKFPCIMTDFINKIPHSTRIVKLYYKGSLQSSVNGGNNFGKTYDREESSTEPTLPVGIEQVKNAARTMDGILLNMVSGTDITVDSLTGLRSHFKGYMHMDLHNVVMRTYDDGLRKQEPVQDWLKWCTNTDTLQMNESEIASLTEEGLSEYEISDKILISGGVHSVIVTRGIKGVSLYEQKKYGEPGIVRTDFPSIKAAKFSDSTGCGDVFASGFFYRICESNLNESVSAINFANKLASRNSELKGAEELYKLVE